MQVLRSGEYSRVVLGVKGEAVEQSYNPRLITPASLALLASTHLERGEAPRLCTREPLPPGTGIAGGWKASYRCWDPNLHPLQKQNVILAAKLSLQSWVLMICGHGEIHF